MYLCNIKQRKPNEELLDWRGNWRFRWLPAKAKAIEKMPDALIYQAMKKLPDRIGGSASGLIRW